MSKRPRFGLRLLLLVVALFAVCFAWRRAVDESIQAERQRMRSDLEDRLATAERGRIVMLQALENLPDDSFRQSISQGMPGVDASISRMREELRALDQ